jgi:hypothetical protein
MPTKRNPKDIQSAPKTAPEASAPAEGASVASGAAGDVAAPSGEANSSGEAGAASEEERVPLNRAERRARGKGGTQSQPTSRGKVTGGKGPASTNRMWANRRSG